MSSTKAAGTIRAADLKPGDITQHAGGSCSDPCPDPLAPWRVEHVDAGLGDRVWVTWSHLPCGVFAYPLPCSNDCPVESFPDW